MKFSTCEALFEWRPAAWMRVTGSDAGNFLQGQFTNDLRGETRGGATYGLWLNVKGKVLADSFILRGAAKHEFWVGSYFSSSSVIGERLESFVIADDVVIEDQTPTWGGMTIFGASAEDVAREKPLGVFSFEGRRAREASVEWIFPLTVREVTIAKWNPAKELSAEEIVRRRIDAGIPAVPADVGPGDLPNEGGLEADAISCTKGCYLGQEVMARLKSMGQVRRRLMRVESREAEIPPLPAALFLGDRQVGELRSAVPIPKGGFVGLAMLSVVHVVVGAKLAFAADAAAVIDVSAAR